ncbi:hypothetical protein GCM10023063_28430 [Arthrobacter methylotrophus]|uniref:Uncharacterized protein n=1 Tax=Arthrobacter methylotrophus TaxID=121291 RepID=A0ABV5UQI6_9MICC
MTEALTDAQRIEYLTNQLRYYKELSARLHQQLLASKNVPESHNGRTITYTDSTGNRAASRADRSRNRNR